MVRKQLYKHFAVFLSLTEDELETMGRNGRKLVEEKYSARKVAQEFVGMYKSV